MPYDRELIAITSDLDWAPNQVLDFMLDPIGKLGIKATIFCTHRIHVGGNYELGLHPNYTKNLERETLVDLMRLVPGCKGIRSHGLFIHSILFQLYHELGIEYDSSYLIPMHIVEPFNHLLGIVEIPMFFADDAYFCGCSPSFNVSDLCLGKAGLKVFNFHPIHVFINTDSSRRYAKAKNFYQKPSHLRRYRKNGRGTRTLFLDLLEYIRKKNVETVTLGEVNRRFRIAGRI